MITTKVKTKLTTDRVKNQVFPLFNEDVHVIGRPDIRDFDELAGKRIAIGHEGSGANLTARLLFQLAGIVPGEALAVDLGEGLAQLKARRIDAVVYVAGYPVRVLDDQLMSADGWRSSRSRTIASSRCTARPRSRRTSTIGRRCLSGPRPSRPSWSRSRLAAPSVK